MSRRYANLPITKSTTTHESKNIYFNISITSNNQQRLTYPSYNITRTRNIIDKASDYYLSIIRFTIPAYYVPILVTPMQDENFTEYSVTLHWKAETGLAPYYFQAFVPDIDNGVDNVVNSSNYVYTYTSFCQAMEVAFQTAFEALLAAHPIAGDPHHPFIIFDPTTSLFQLWAQADVFDDHDATIPGEPLVDIYMNDKLFALFGSFWSKRFNAGSGFSANGADVKLIVNGYGLTQSYSEADVDLYTVMTQDFSTIYNWNPYKKIIMVTNLLPTQSEFVKGEGDGTLKILTDFEPSNDVGDVRSVYQYYPTSQYRLTDLLSDSPIRNVDLQVYWQDLDGTLTPIYVPWNGQITIKMAFLHKSLYGESYSDGGFHAIQRGL